MSQDYRWLRNAARKLPLSPEVSRVNRTALQENVWRLLMSVICGESLQESFAKLSLDGSWLRMYQGFCQVSMDGFSDEFSGTWPEWGTMRDGECFLLSRLVCPMNAKEFALLPTPLASDSDAWDKTGLNVLHSIRSILREERGKSKRTSYLMQLCGKSVAETASFYETMMGFPLHWTELDASGTP